MNRRRLEKHLRAYGCILHHHGAKHDFWVNPANLNQTSVPRHTKTRAAPFEASAVSWAYLVHRGFRGKPLPRQGREATTSMSPILEAQVGDEIVCIGDFSASPNGEGFSWATSRTFRVGERMRYASYFRDDHFKDHPAGWMVLFDAADGKRYSSTQT